MIRVTLTASEIETAVRVGGDRELNAVMKRWRDPLRADRTDGQGWALHIQGALGEAVLAKALNVWWTQGTDAGKRADGDVVGLECRTTAYPDGCLILHNEDNPTRAYVLVIDRCPEFTLAGWLTLPEAQQHPHWWRGKRPAWFVPQQALHDMADLTADLTTPVGAP